MGQQVSVETFSSSRDAEGHKYWASFDPYPFRVGARKLAYMGILNGDGPLRGEKCVVKTVRDKTVSRQDWQLEGRKVKIARNMAQFYNKIIPAGKRQVTFSMPITAEIDSVSDCLCINDIIGKPKKKFADSEFVAIELYLKGPFEVFEYGWVNKEELMAPEAFTHFSWCRSEGNLLIANLQGVKTKSSYHFTGPAIHSEGKEFGSTDQGIDGIKGFFKLHKCNSLCKDWPRFGDGVDLRGWGEYIGMHNPNARRPSAPPTDYNRQNNMPGYTPPPYNSEDFALYRHGLPDRHHERQNGPRDNSGALVFPPACTDQQADCTGNPLLALDWREQYFNQNLMFLSRYSDANPQLRSEGYLASQLLWIVREMSYSVYAPPPPYRPDAPPQLIGYRTEKRVEAREYYAGMEDGSRMYLQCGDPQKPLSLPPPPYSEENANANCEFVTYL